MSTDRYGHTEHLTAPAAVDKHMTTGTLDAAARHGTAVLPDGHESRYRQAADALTAPILSQNGEPIMLLASDLDGTLLDEDEQIAAGNAEAIHRAEAAHSQFLMVGATGRPWEQTGEFVSELTGPDTYRQRYYIVANGAQIRDAAGNICFGHDKNIPEGKLAETYTQLKDEFGEAAQIGVNRSLTPEKLSELAAEGKPTPHWFPADPQYVHEWGGEPNQPASQADLLRGPAVKMMVRITKPADWPADDDTYLEQRCAQVQEMVGDDLAVTISNAGETLEIGPTGTNKGTALAVLCKELGIPLDRAAVAGDNANDEPMFEVVRDSGGQSIAVRNARESVRDPENLADLKTTITMVRKNTESAVRDVVNGIAAGWRLAAHRTMDVSAN